MWCHCGELTNLVEQIELKALVMDTKVKIKPRKAAIDRALACAILSRVDRLSVHTKAALEKISRRLLDGEPVAHDEWRRWFTAILRRRWTERRCELRLGKIDAENGKGIRKRVPFFAISIC